MISKNSHNKIIVACIIIGLLVLGLVSLFLGLSEKEIESAINSSFEQEENDFLEQDAETIDHEDNNTEGVDHFVFDNSSVSAETSIEDYIASKRTELERPDYVVTKDEAPDQEFSNASIEVFDVEGSNEASCWNNCIYSCDEYYNNVCNLECLNSCDDFGGVEEADCRHDCYTECNDGHSIDYDCQDSCSDECFGGY